MRSAHSCRGQTSWRAPDRRRRQCAEGDPGSSDSRPHVSFSFFTWPRARSITDEETKPSCSNHFSAPAMMSLATSFCPPCATLVSSQVISAHDATPNPENGSFSRIFLSIGCLDTPMVSESAGYARAAGRLASTPLEQHRPKPETCRSRPAARRPQPHANRACRHQQDHQRDQLALAHRRSSMPARSPATRHAPGRARYAEPSRPPSRSQARGLAAAS